MNTANLSIELEKELNLSLSEKQIVEGVVMGLCNKEIANQTFKTEQTVKLEFEVIKTKLNMTSRAQVIVYFLNKINFY